MNLAPRQLLGIVSRTLIVLAAILSVVVSPTGANAQCGPVSNTERAIAGAKTVFVGEVVETNTAGTIAQIRVESVWKGRDLSSIVEVRGSATGAVEAGTLTFSVGGTYLVVPENSRPPFLATSCSATQAYSAPPNLIPTAYQEATGSAVGRDAVVAASSAAADAALIESILPLLGLIALIGITWAIISYFRGLEPQRTTSFAPEPEPAPAGETKVRKRRRSMKRDLAGASRVRARTLRKNTRGFKRYRRKQARQVASSRKASGSTETS